MDVLLTNKLISDFAKEALEAPQLFEDLSKMEKYISETYKRRSVIELIQNADDANSHCFGIHKTSFGFAVGNDGRVFDEQDLVALCRSGVSNKQRGQNTIGYRGIGFKSVASIASTIVLFSGDFTVCFNKKMTQELIKAKLQVPLIRIPHHFTDVDIMGELNGLKEKYSYNTIFAFVDVDYEILQKEIMSFDPTCLLFLNNVEKVVFAFDEFTKEYTKSFKFTSSNYLVKISDNCNNISEWMIFKTLIGNAIAFKCQDGHIISANVNESVFHSFMPTLEFSGGLFKINGDFSTDPSRKNIDLDMISRNVLNDVALLLANLFYETILGNLILKGFYVPFENISNMPQSDIGNALLQQVVSILKEKKWKGFSYDSLRMQPSWLNFSDFSTLCSDRFFAFPKDFGTTYPNANRFFEYIGIKSFSLKDVIGEINQQTISEQGYAQFVIKIISTYFCEQSPEVISIVKNLKIFPTTEGVVSANTLNLPDLKVTFLNEILSKACKEDIIDFFEMLGFKTASETLFEQNDIKSNELAKFVNSSKIEKWRRAELNLADFIKLHNGIKEVKDVSLSNLGYDLEVLFENDTRVYVEVKSVKYWGEPIRLTNNEYTCAHHNRDSYYLALVLNTDDFNVVFIKNPIHTLSLTKQCERWSWVCHEFGKEQIDIREFIRFNIYG